MSSLRTGLFVALVMYSALVSAQVEFRLAYMDERPNSVAAQFPNDRLFKFMAASPYVAASELRHALVVHDGERIAVLVTITESARRKFNRIVAANQRSLRRPAGGERLGLAVLVGGQIHSVLQGVHLLTAREMQLDAGDDQLPNAERLQSAQDLAQRINDGAAKVPSVPKRNKDLGDQR